MYNTWGIMSSPVIVAMFSSTPAFLATSCRAAAQPSGFTPPALLTTRTPEKNITSISWFLFVFSCPNIQLMTQQEMLLIFV